MLLMAQPLGSGQGSRITGAATITATAAGYFLEMDFSQSAVQRYDEIYATQTSWQADDQLKWCEFK